MAHDGTRRSIVRDGKMWYAGFSNRLTAKHSTRNLWERPRAISVSWNGSSSGGPAHVPEPPQQSDSAFQEFLQPRLPEPYFAKTDERVWVEATTRYVEPDVDVFLPSCQE
jgi:hypothetical protein